MDSLLVPPPPLAPLQRRLVWIVFLIVAATRFFALSSTLWDWDEAQFASGIRDVNVGNPYHHPHPPGFPVYMALANLVRVVAPSDFAALQTVNFIAACALFPLGFLLARELRFRFSTAFLGALLFVFLPNVWFYGGTGFSDIPGLALTLAAAAMLLRGCRSGRDYLIGALLLGLASGMRPQALMLGGAPLAVATWFQFKSSWRRVVLAAVISAGTVVIAYAGIVVATGSLEEYLLAVRDVGHWVRAVDAYTSPNRPPLVTLVDEFFVRPMGAGRLGIVVSALAALGALRGLRRDGSRVGLALLTFLPFSCFAYLSLDLNSIHRYSVAYLFLWTLLAAHAVSPIAGYERRWQVYGQVVLLLLMTGRYAQWTSVLLMEVRSTEPPTHAVSMWLRKHVPSGGRVWVDGSLGPFGEYFLADRKVIRPRDRAEVLSRGETGEYFAVEGVEPAEGAISFVRPRGRIWDVARQRYFAASVIPIGSMWNFGEGWHDEEYLDTESWRWMGTRAEILVPRGAGRARLRLELTAIDLLAPLMVEVSLNGQLVERFPLPGEPTMKEWIVTSRADAPNQLVIRSTAIANLKQRGISEDERDLSVRLSRYSWQPVR